MFRIQYWLSIKICKNLSGNYIITKDCSGVSNHISYDVTEPV